MRQGGCVKIRQALQQIEERRGSRAIILAASNLEIELLPPLYDMLRQLGPSERLDVVLYCRGGIVNGARRIALMLREFSERLAFIVPDRCESAGTIMALAAEEIVAGPAAVFSPVDPMLGAEGAAEGAPRAISAEDIRLFARMAQDWFGLEETDARQRALAIFCDNVFPTTLASFHRSTLEVRAICEELLSLHLPADAGEAKSRIIEGLMFGHHSHSFALSGGGLAKLGLAVRSDPAIEDSAWRIAGMLRGAIGAGCRSTERDDWIDALIADRSGGVRRRRSPATLAPIWEAVEVQ